MPYQTTSLALEVTMIPRSKSIGLRSTVFKFSKINCTVQQSILMSNLTEPAFTSNILAYLINLFSPDMYSVFGTTNDDVNLGE